MNQDENELQEHIDKSQWVKWTKDDPMVKPERAIKGDITIERDPENSDIRFAQVQVRNILNWLWNAEIITDQEHHDGQTFQIWRDMHRTALGLTKAISSGEPAALGVRLRAYGFVLIAKRLSRLDYGVIEKSIDMHANEHTIWFAGRHKQQYRAAFAKLSTVIIVIRDQISYLEGLSEDDREAMSEERLKNLVAKIVKCC